MIQIASIMAAALLLVPVARGQQAPTRDAPATPTSGSGSISGVVVNDAEPAQPVRRAIVTLAGAGLRPNRGAITDDDGRFTIAGLPAGRFTLTVSRASFITSIYGAKRPGRPGTAIALADGEQLAGITVRLWRGAAVAGVLRDDRGAPAEGIEIVATPARRPAGTGILTLSNNGSRTNERGEFRIFGLEPGTYVIAARPGAGGPSPILAMSEAEVDAAIEAVKQRASTALGSAQVAATSAPSASPQPRPFDYSPIYFPGTPQIAQAQPFTLTAGQEVTGVEFALSRVATASVTGVVRRADGQPIAGASVQMTAVMPAAAFAATPLQLDATVAPDGSFQIHQVTPGMYRIVARAAAQAPPAQDPRVGFVSPTPTGAQLWASSELSVVGTDIADVALTVEPGPTMTGRLVFDSATSRQPPADLTRISVSMFPAEIVLSPAGTSITTIAFIRPAAARADATFRLDSIPPGQYRFQVGGPALGSEWTVRSAMAGDVDLMDGEVAIAPGINLSNVVVTLTDRRTGLSGRLQTAAGAAVTDVFVIAYAADAKQWMPGSRRVHAVRPDADGRFTFEMLPPGEYLVAAVMDVDQDEWRDRAFLEQLVPASIKVTLVEGETKIQDLRIGG